MTTNLKQLFIPIPDRDYEMQATQVTQKLWQEVMGSNPSKFKNKQNPVETVSWNDCQSFIEKLNSIDKEYIYRLPTEKEWEHACRAGSTTDYCFGDDGNQLKDYAWYCNNSEESTHPVGQKKPNAWGLFDMHGNVWEWCQDLYLNSGSYRVLRGGSWFNSPENLRSALRNDGGPGERSGNVGLRLLRTKSQSSNSITLDSSEAAKLAEARKQIRIIRRKLKKIEEMLE